MPLPLHLLMHMLGWVGLGIFRVAQNRTVGRCGLRARTPLCSALQDRVWALVLWLHSHGAAANI